MSPGRLRRRPEELTSCWGAQRSCWRLRRAGARQAASPPQGATQDWVFAAQYTSGAVGVRAKREGSCRVSSSSTAVLRGTSAYSLDEG